MKKLTILFSLILFFGCSNDDSNNNESQEQNFETKEITVSIVLPDNSNINPDDLKISSLFTVEGDINNGNGTVELFDNDAMELIYATNSSGNVVLMRYVNPIAGDEVVLDSRTTAQSLVLLHPWAMNLSVQAKQEAFQEIALLPEFEDYHNLVIQGINMGEINPLASQGVLQAIDNFQGSFLNRIEEEQLPLLMVAENNSVNLTNKKSSMAYNLQLFDENQQPIGDSYLVDGVNKELISWSNVLNFLSGNIDIFQPTNIDFAIPSENQQYLLKADRWSGEAAWRNGAEITSNLVGIVSTTLGLILKNANCALDLGNLFVSGAITIIQQLTNGELSNADATRELLDFILSNKDTIESITNSCSTYTFPSTAFGKLLNKLSIIGNLENGAVLIFNIADIAIYDSEIEFCFERTESQIIDCGEIDLSGTWFANLNTSNCDNFQNPDCFLSFDANNFLTTSATYNTAGGNYLLLEDNLDLSWNGSHLHTDSCDGMNYTYNMSISLDVTYEPSNQIFVGNYVYTVSIPNVDGTCGFGETCFGSVILERQ